jgi:hypothetical protein
MEGAAAAGETMTMRDRIRIFVLALALALNVVVAPAQAWPEGDHGGKAAVGWWVAVVDALAALFGLDTADGSLGIDPWGGGTDNPEPPSTPQGDGSCGIDPWGGCHS